jgi:hypothetical protein
MSTNILRQLSSQLGTRNEQANLAVVARCLARPALLADIVDGLATGGAALMGDCAEVLTHVAEERPDLVAPFAKAITARLAHSNTRVRWESMHALANIAGTAPKTVAPLLDQLRFTIRRDTSVIVRDYAVKTVGSYSLSSTSAATTAFPILVEALDLWNGKHAALALQGLANIVTVAPAYADKMRTYAARFLSSERGVIRKAAKRLEQAAIGAAKP